MAPLPETCRFTIPNAWADELLAAAERLPMYANRDYYSVDVQTSIYQRMYHQCPDAMDWLVVQVHQRLAKRPYSALLSGLSFDTNHRLFVALNRAFGALVAAPYKKPRTQLVHHIQPATDRPSTEIGHNSTEQLHTDTADWDPPVEIISMVCVRPDPYGGGHSLVLDIDSIRQAVVQNLGIDALHILASEQIPWKLPPYQGNGFVWRPILTDSTVCWRRYTINQSVAATDRQLSKTVVATLDAFETLLANTSWTLEFSMGAGEMLFLNNWRTLHARTYIENAQASERLMLRSWILTNNSRACV